MSLQCVCCVQVMFSTHVYTGGVYTMQQGEFRKMQKVPFSVRLRPDLMADLTECADHLEVPMTFIIESALDAYLPPVKQAVKAKQLEKTAQAAGRQ